MRKKQFSILISFFFLSMFLSAQHIPFPDDEKERGYYNRPYKRYEAEPGKCVTNGIFLDATHNQSALQSEASNQIALQLIERGSYVEWTIDEEADGLTLRFSLPDNEDGTGTRGSFALYIDDGYNRNISLNSYWSWQYFPKTGSGHADNQPDDSKFARMRFDEMHVRLKKKIPAGGKLKLVKTEDNTIPYTIDFIELENVPEPVVFEEIEDRNKIMYDSSVDLSEFVRNNGGKTIYVPEGKHEVYGRIFITEDNTKIIGAGIWHTELYFNASSDNIHTYVNRGIETYCNNITVEGLYLNTVNNKRYYDNNEAYQVGKGFMGSFGNNSVIRDVWVEHFECGAWLGNYKQTASGNLLVEHCRFRNNYADGLNLCSGMKNAVVQYCSFRNNGDDDMASWSSDTMCENNTFRYNTAENNWRASSIGFFGGKQNTAHHCVILDAMEAGIRATCDFRGTGFSTEGYCSFSDISIYRSGAIGGTPGISGDLWGNQQGAVQLYSTQEYDLTNFKLANIDIYDAKNDAILIASHGKKFRNLVLHNIHIEGAGRWGIYYYQPEGDATFCNLSFNRLGTDGMFNYIPSPTVFSFTEDCDRVDIVKKKCNDNLSCYTREKTIIVEGALHSSVMVYDTLGKIRYDSHVLSERTVIEDVYPNIYFVRVNSHDKVFKVWVR
ncbi:MAG: right-handed parallel beta-helix repeat-containing protein [Candidatus Azobacteroides sp.]|nr:right-handed parallel beta-helix repeat-containing protein [Candidatus Azobacteroides sp.]